MQLAGRSWWYDSTDVGYTIEHSATEDAVVGSNTDLGCGGGVMMTTGMAADRRRHNVALFVT